MRRPGSRRGWCWQSLKDPIGRGADARRITAILLATAAAETAGFWPALGKTTGAGVRTLTLDVRTARARMSEVLKAAELGADIAITRHGRRVARVVGAA